MPVYFTSLLGLEFEFTLSLKSILYLREFFKASMQHTKHIVSKFITIHPKGEGLAI